MWDVVNCKNIFRVIEIEVSDYSHRLKVLWSVFDKISVIRKLIRIKVEVEISKVTFGKGLLTYDHMLVVDHVVDIMELWDTVKSMLS